MEVTGLCGRGGGGRHPDMSSQGKEKDNYMQRMTGGGERQHGNENRTRSEPADSSF